MKLQLLKSSAETASPTTSASTSTLEKNVFLSYDKQ